MNHQSQMKHPLDTERKAYVAPRIMSSEAFEQLALACTGVKANPPFLGGPAPVGCPTLKSGTENGCASCAGS